MAPELSIIVPILNEEEQLPCLLTDLIRQQQVDFELLVCDGGSRDDSLPRLYAMRDQLPYPVRVIECEKGRGQQMNTGADAASGEWLLFLHVDSRFDDPLALRQGIDILEKDPQSLVAGHYRLRFRRSTGEDAFGYYYHEWKAQLDRPDCLHGDQGMLMRRLTFRTIGLFRRDLPVMEDTDFAERLRQRGRWILFPAEISTSARRFEREGLKQRQLISALIMNFRTIGWTHFFSSVRDVYLPHHATGRLLVLPFLRQVRDLLARKAPRDRRAIWFRSGCYIRSHAWQLAFYLDAKRAFRRGTPPGEGNLFYVRLFEMPFNLLTDNPLGRLAATLLLKLWFRWTCYRAWRREKGMTEAIEEPAVN
ncbi:MAG: TIGR04283 family arsenosugar biosynthesis glycosyltransferase [Desulfuromonadales bacterium]|jgi:rSAM/selenodomain-associated transferase 2|nr:TIGR04283 family arsenosugar biosynthesis glycosyltransferase [Desulfuromonadales bacterium]